MAKQYNTPGQAKVVFRKSGSALKIIAAIALVACLVTAMPLGIAIFTVQQRIEGLRQRAAELQADNALLQQYIDDLDSVQGIERIAFEILGLINPDTIIIDPQN